MLLFRFRTFSFAMTIQIYDKLNRFIHRFRMLKFLQRCKILCFIFLMIQQKNLKILKALAQCINIGER